MVVVDYHGKTIEDALRDAEEKISNARAAGSAVQVEFITGHGKIKQELPKLLKKYKIECAEKLGNTGALIAILE